LIYSLFKKEFFGTKTFTYYIPTPPPRKSGYQEKEFDHLIDHLNELGFKLIDFSLTSHSSAEKSGMWIVCHLGAYDKKTFEQKIDFTSPHEITLNPSHVELDPDIIHD
jgi:hypothetical protein